MANFIDDITEVKGDWSLKVRVVGLWKQKNHRGRDDIHMILIDEKNSSIESTIPSFFVNKFSQVIKENSIYKISNFGVDENTNRWKITQHSYKITFFHSTRVQQCSDASITSIGTNLVDFESILSGQLSENTCVDVVGELIEFNDTVTIKKKDGSRDIKKLEIKVEDQSKKVLSCTLWDRYAEEMKSHIEGCKDERVILIFQFFRVKVFRGDFTITNGLFGSKIHFDHNLSDIVAFMESSTTNESGSPRGITHVSTITPDSKEDTFFNHSFKKSLLEINDAFETGFGVVVANVVDFEDKINWYYHACKKCVRKVEPEGDKFNCKSCKTLVNMPSIRYKMKLIVCEDGVNFATFTLFDKIVQSYVGKAAGTLLDQHTDMNEFPKDLNFFLDKTFLFKIGIDEGNLKFKERSSYTVKDMTDDMNLIEEFKKLSAFEKDMLSDAYKDDNGSSVCSTESATSKKRAFESVSDGVEESVEEFGTKTLKAVKVEKEDN